MNFLILPVTFLAAFTVVNGDSFISKIPIEQAVVKSHRQTICITVKGVEKCVKKDLAPGDPEEVKKLFNKVEEYNKQRGDMVAGHSLNSNGNNEEKENESNQDVEENETHESVSNEGDGGGENVSGDEEENVSGKHENVSGDEEENVVGKQENVSGDEDENVSGRHLNLSGEEENVSGDKQENVSGEEEENVGGDKDDEDENDDRVDDDENVNDEDVRRAELFIKRQRLHRRFYL